MVKKDQEIEENLVVVGIIKKILSILLLFFSISLMAIMLTFNSTDKGWGVVSDKTPTNLYNEIGAWLSGIIVKELGVFPGFLLSLILVIWSLKLFNNSKITFLKIKLSAIFLLVSLSSIGGTYLESILVKTFNLNFPLISQLGLSEWLLLNFSNGTSNFLDVDLL